MDQEIVPPPWSSSLRKRVTLAIALFILSVSCLVGVGIYNEGIAHGFISRPFTKQELIQNLLNDGSFVRVVHQIALRRTCQNTIFGLSYQYTRQLSPVTLDGEAACLTLIGKQADGSTVKVLIQRHNEADSETTKKISEQFSSVNTTYVNRPNLVIHELTGIMNHQFAVVYVIRHQPMVSYTITAYPTSPLFEDNLGLLIQSIHFEDD